jgi:hypothetical protein
MKLCIFEFDVSNWSYMDYFKLKLKALDQVEPLSV